MVELICTRGISGSGKSTWAKWYSEKTGAYRINRDELRMMMFGKKVGLDHIQEKALTTFTHAAAEALLLKGHSVVVDEMNLRAQYVRAWKAVADRVGAEFAVEEFEVPLAELLERQANRPEEDRVPDEVVQTLFQKFCSKDGTLNKVNLTPDQKEIETAKVYEPDTSLPPAIIVDLDGTLAMLDSRNPYDFSRVGEDSVNAKTLQIVRNAVEGGAFVVFLTGRDDSCRRETEAWLDEHVSQVIPLDNSTLIMKPTGDRRRGVEFKLEVFNRDIRDKYHALFALDDLDSVVKMWRSIQLPVLQVV